MKLELSKTKKRININFEYEPIIVNFVKSIPGSKWEHEKKLWTIPITSFEYLSKNVVLSDDVLNLIKPEYDKRCISNPYTNSFGLVHGIITSQMHGLNLEFIEKYFEQIRIIDDLDKYRNPSAKRTKTLLTEIDNPKIFVGIITDRLFKDNMAKHSYTALKAIGHPVAQDRAWFEQRYCDPQRTQYGRDVNGFSNKEELINNIKNIVTDSSILE